MEALVDANGNRTRWERDVQGRVTREIRADNLTDTVFTYDSGGHLKTITDARAQVTTHTYNLDDSLSGTAYTNEQIDTPNVSYTYDMYYPRLVAMADGIGTTAYTFKTAGSNGAGQVASIDGPLSNDTIAYTYDDRAVIQRRSRRTKSLTSTVRDVREKAAVCYSYAASRLTPPHLPMTMAHILMTKRHPKTSH